MARQLNQIGQLSETLQEDPSSTSSVSRAVLLRKNMIAKAVATALALTSASCAIDESNDIPSLSKAVDSKETKAAVPKLSYSMGAVAKGEYDLRNYSIDMIAYEDTTVLIKGIALDDPTNTFETTITIDADEEIGKGVGSQLIEFSRPVARFEMEAFDKNGQEMPINFSGQDGTIRGEAIADVSEDFGIEAQQ